MQAVSGIGVEGTVRLGLLQDFAETILPGVLATFSRAHPVVEVDVQVERSVDLQQGIRTRRLDLAVLFSRGPVASSSTRIGKLPMRWVVYPGFRPEESLRMVLFSAPCLFGETGGDPLGSKTLETDFYQFQFGGNVGRG